MADFRPAQVPYSPTTDVAPMIQAPNDQLRVQANPEDFGAQVGTSLQQGGQDIGGAAKKWGEVADTMRTNLNHATEVSASQSTMSQVADKYAQVRTTEGANAAAAYQAAQAQVHDIVEKTASQFTGAAQVGFRQEMARRIEAEDYGTRNYVALQTKAASVQAAQADVDLEGRTLRTNFIDNSRPIDDTALGPITDKIMIDAHVKGITDPTGFEKYKQQQLGTWTSQTAKLLVDTGQVDKAAALFQQMMPRIDAKSQDDIGGLLKHDGQLRLVNGLADLQIAKHTMGDTNNYASVANKIIINEGSGKNSNSTAEGIGGFTNATWISAVKQFNPDYAAGHNTDEILALRHDPTVATQIATKYVTQTALTLQGAGIQPTPANIYLGHFLGREGAIKAINTAATNPSAPITDIVGAAAIQANPNILTNPDGSAKSVKDVMDWTAQKMAGVAIAKDEKAAAQLDIPDEIKGKPELENAYRLAVSQKMAAVSLQSSAEQAAQKAAADASLNSFMSEAIHSVSGGGGLDKSFMDRVAKDPNLTAASKKDLFDTFRSYAANPEEKTYGPGFTEALKAINLSAGAPGRVNSDTDLLGLVTQGQITVAGLKQAQEFRKMANENPGQATMIEAALKGAKGHITGSDNGYADPDGDTRYAKWVAYALPQIYKGLGEGKPMAELIDEKGPIMKSISQFKPSLADTIKKPDAVSAAPDTSYQEFPISKYDLGTNEGKRAALMDLQKFARNQKALPDKAYLKSMYDQIVGPEAPVSSSTPDQPLQGP